MPLEQFRTQVLLLHSEQRTLDKLSAGFSDRYTVHCATSGSEALNTLGETPIHVIISAQDLPGMSGVEALREAKKRSPDTIGILLASSDDEDVEALVGEKEVFQIVRGGISAEDLGRLIDNATRQIRLLALAESANDQAANPDEPATEHIIMETSANGSTIISDGTGRLPVLDPKKVSAQAAVGARSVDVLVLTKDEEFLTTIRESARGLHTVHYANTLKQAEGAVQNNPVGVVVVDAAMVGDNIEKLTLHLRRLKNRLVAIVAGRRDDGEMLMDLINRGKVYRFLLKPVSPGRARLAVEASVKHHLEAPDSAFKPVAGGAPAARPAAPGKPAAVARPEPRTAAKVAPKAKPSAALKPAGPNKAPSSPTGEHPLVEDGLSTAFDGDDSSFTETMTGIVTSIGKSLVGRKDEKPLEAPSGPPVDGRAAAPVSPFANPKVLSGGAVAVLAVLGIGFWLFGGSDEKPVAEDSDPVPVAETGRTSEAPLAAPAAGVSRDRLAAARAARDAGNLFAPPADNAIEHYAAAREAAPGNAEVAAELAAAIEQALALAESAMLRQEFSDAAAALAAVSAAEPGHPRLPFLTAQVAQMQLVQNLSDARIAIREARFEDASAALAAARALNVADRSEIETVAEELRTARSEQRVEDVLARAAERFEDGQLTEPANDNARYYYELVLSSDPENPAARQGLVAVAGKLVLLARAEIDAGDFAAAETLLADAGRLDPTSAELTSANSALADARQRVAEEAERAAALRRAQEEQAALAERAAEAERQARAAEAEKEAALAEVAAAGDPTASSERAEGGAGGAGTADTAAATQVASGSPLAVSALTRTRYVAPKYPRAAERRNVSGWVDVVFTVAVDGTVKDIEILGSEPGDTFVSAAERAVEKWEFEPVMEDGEAVEKRAGVRMMFALE